MFYFNRKFVFTYNEELCKKTQFIGIVLNKYTSVRFLGRDIHK